MSQKKKLIARIRENPNDVRFDDACKVAGWIGFEKKGGKGAHVAWSRHGEPTALNFQNRDGKIPAYQARQLIEMLNKYGEE
jgi:hypothetical protein